MNPTPIEIISGRANAHIDPTLHIWGWEIPVYLFLGGLVAGLMVVLGALELRKGGQRPNGRLALMPFWGVALMSLGMGALFLDLAFKMHVWRFYATFQPTSPMSWGSWLLLLVYPTLLLMGLGGLTDSQRATLDRWVGGGRIGRLVGALTTWSQTNRRAILGTSVAVGAGLGAYTGILLGTLNARPLWNSALFGPLFLTSGISTGAALLLLARPDQESSHTIVRWDIAAIALELSLLLLVLIGHETSGGASKAAADLFLGGAWTPWFWTLVMLAGLAVPLALELLEVRRGLAMTALAPILVLIGGFALRAILVGAGQETSFAMAMLP